MKLGGNDDQGEALSYALHDLLFNADQSLPSVIICGTSIVSIITGSENFSL